jgi:succinyl-diaminopimelate desuccinylase
LSQKFSRVEPQIRIDWMYGKKSVLRCARRAQLSPIVCLHTDLQVNGMPSELNALWLSRRLLAFNTINPPGRESDCAHYLGRQLEESGFHVRYFDFDEARTSLVAQLPGETGTTPICFTGHLDTVPLGAASWTCDPFGTDEVDGRLYGRGSSDMKAAVAAIVVAACRISNAADRSAGLTIVLTAGEETCCRGAQHLATLGHEALGAAGALVVGEPTSNQPVIAHKGCIRVAITTRGRTAHASMPEEGVNAIYRAAEVIQTLRHHDFGLRPHPLLGSPTLSVGTIAGGMNINSVPDQTTLGIDIRTIPGQREDDVVSRLRERVGHDVEVDLLESASSVETDRRHPWVQDVIDIVGAQLGAVPDAGGATYFTDASVLTSAFGHPPTVIIGPGEASQAHKTDEYCEVQKIEDAVDIYTSIARRWCCASK